jgi:hypothetical protein
LFDQPPYKIIVVGLENLYISAQFCREAPIRMNHVMVHGVCRKDAAIHPMSYKKSEEGRASSSDGEKQKLLYWRVALNV